MSFTTAPRRRLVLLLSAALVAALGGFVTQASTAGPPSPTNIVVNRVYSPGIPIPSGLPTGAAPTALVVVGSSFSVEVAFLDARGKSTPLDVATRLSMTAVGNTSEGNGVDVPLTPTLPVDVDAGQRTATLTGTFEEAANQVLLTVIAEDLPLGMAPGRDLPFDVLAEYRSDVAKTEQGIGGFANCTNATPGDPVCGTLLLPKLAAESSTVFMSLGACDDTEYTQCRGGLGSIVQVLADLTVPNPNPKRAEIDLYTKTSPATLILKCDTSLCGTGAIRAIPVNYSFSGNGPLLEEPATACPRKGTVGQDQELCVDYVQSKRDGASDTILYLLFTRDLRGGIG